MRELVNVAKQFLRQVHVTSSLSVVMNAMRCCQMVEIVEWFFDVQMNEF